MFIFKSLVLLNAELARQKESGKEIGFVPTMGALHHGHLSLLKRARQENDTLVCSIFVNPKQFDDKKDLTAYPRTLTADVKYLMEAGVDYLLLPNVDDVYSDSYVDDDIDLNGLDTIIEGKLRPGHFQGVAKVVKRFFDFVIPTRAYFGQKDFQQTVVINHLVKHFQLPIHIEICPIVREDNGLAMSSRNERLSDEQRSKAAFIYKSLIDLKERCFFKPLEQAIATTSKYLNSLEGADLEYLVCVNGDTLEEVTSLKDADYVVALIVVRYGGVRLLDNMILKKN